MPITTRVLKLDAAGSGSLHVGPAWYAGSDLSGTATVTAEVGGSLGIAPLTASTMKLASGEILVHGPADGVAKLFFNHSL